MKIKKNLNLLANYKIYSIILFEQNVKLNQNRVG